MVVEVTIMKKLSFGFMRLPLENDEIDYDKVCEMVDYGMERGFNFFDSGYEYCEGKSDIAIRKCVVDRYPREDIVISNKLPIYSFDENTNMKEVFNEQLENCGVEYFDYYMLHCLTDKIYEGVTKELDGFGFVKNLKEKGLIKKLGISLHDNADVLERILNQHPEIEFVMLQLNYLDWINASIQSSRCYKVAKKYGKEILVMEPLKGGTLVNIPEDAERMFKNHHSDLSTASWGIRFAASLDNVSTVFSGMSNLEQMKDNISYMEDFEPLDRQEQKTIRKARKIIAESIPIACTYCDYCIPVCPENILIPKFFAIYNDAKTSLEAQELHNIYFENYERENSPISACTECGECEAICTQHLKIIDDLKEVEKFFKK